MKTKILTVICALGFLSGCCTFGGGYACDDCWPRVDIAPCTSCSSCGTCSDYSNYCYNNCPRYYGYTYGCGCRGSYMGNCVRGYNCVTP